jgi:hypothetical protein
MMEFFGDRAKDPMKLLFTGFFFREPDDSLAANRTIEFTHKTFYEYLTARKLVRELDIIARNMAGKRKDPDYPWDASKALVHWAELCGPTAMNKDLFQFLVNEVKLQPEQAPKWQEDLRQLIEYMLAHGMPIHQVGQAVKYKEASRMARNTEEALLAAISACARVTNDRYTIKWPEKTSAGDWICRLRGQRKETELAGCFALSLFNHIDLSGQYLCGQDLRSADLSHADLMYANLFYANLSSARLACADLSFAHLSDADLGDADLSSAILRSANLACTYLSFAKLIKANLVRANLFSAYLKGADFRDAKLDGAVLNRANLEGAKGLPKDLSPYLKPAEETDEDE